MTRAFRSRVAGFRSRSGQSPVLKRLPRGRHRLTASPEIRSDGDVRDTAGGRVTGFVFSRVRAHRLLLAAALLTVLLTTAVLATLTAYSGAIGDAALRHSLLDTSQGAGREESAAATTLIVKADVPPQERAGRRQGRTRGRAAHLRRAAGDAADADAVGAVRPAEVPAARRRALGGPGPHALRGAGPDPGADGRGTPARCPGRRPRDRGGPSRGRRAAAGAEAGRAADARRPVRRPEGADPGDRPVPARARHLPLLAVGRPARTRGQQARLHDVRTAARRSGGARRRRGPADGAR